MNIHGIYCELDSLLDTRLATIFLNKDASYMEELLSNKNIYFSRIEDSFKGLSKSNFRNLYEKRDKLTLKESGRTKILVLIKGVIGEIVTNKQLEAISAKPKLFLNTYPYELTQEEDLLFLRLLIQLTDRKCDIEIIHKSPKEISLSFAKQNFKAMFMYDYSAWLEAHAEEFKTYKLPEVELYGPALYFGRVPTKEEEVEIKNTKKDAFSLMELGSSMYIGLKLIPVDFFSLNL